MLVIWVRNANLPRSSARAFLLHYAASRLMPCLLFWTDFKPLQLGPLMNGKNNNRKKIWFLLTCYGLGLWRRRNWQTKKQTDGYSLRIRWWFSSVSDKQRNRPMGIAYVLDDDLVQSVTNKETDDGYSLRIRWWFSSISDGQRNRPMGIAYVLDDDLVQSVTNKETDWLV